MIYLNTNIPTCILIQHFYDHNKVVDFNLYITNMFDPMHIKLIKCFKKMLTSFSNFRVMIVILSNKLFSTKESKNAIRIDGY